MTRVSNGLLLHFLCSWINQMRVVLAVTAYRIQYAGEQHGNKVFKGLTLSKWRYVVFMF